MLKITQITAAQAKNYYAKDDHYYAKTETTSEWAGELAADLNLAGSVDGHIFEAMLTGELPNGIVLPGKGNHQEQRRAGFDATFSAPKSISIAALLNDDRLIEVHQQAVKTALKVAEIRYAQDREWNRETKVVEVKQTGNLAIALFLHDTSRDLDPNLHTHAVILNGTKDANGNYRALYTDELYGHRKLLDDIYLNELAHGARQLGYEIEPTTDGFELAGYPQELRDTFSQRRKTIERHVAEQIKNGAVADGKLYQQAALATRTRKREADRDTLLDNWVDVLAVKGLTLPTTPVVHLQNDIAVGGQMQAIVAAHDGIDHAEERESVFRRGKVERFALEHHVGLQSWRQLQMAIANTNQLIQVDAIRDKYTTQTAIIQERETIALMKQGQGRFAEIATIGQIVDRLPDSLTTGQRAALELGITTSDQIIAWQGVAGAGKTYALNLYREIATESGYNVRSFAPSAAAADVLGVEAGMPSDTVASLLYSKKPDVDTLKNREIWVIDEAGLLSAKDCYVLLHRARAENARVLLVGDTKQLSAVEAGNPFKSLQQHGIAIAHMEQSLRQKNARLKAAVDAIANGDLMSGFHHLDQIDSIRGVQNQEQRVSTIVQDYLALSPIQRQKTLIIANTNAERRSITQAIRQGLQSEGRLAADTFTLTSLKARDLTTVEAKYAQNYEPGDILIPTQDYRKQQLTKGQQYEVVAIDPTTNRLTVEAENGQRFELDPSQCERKTVYQTELIPIAPGDSLRWTRNDRAQGRRNGQAFTIEGLDDQGQAIIRDADGKTAFIELSGRQFVDYAIVSTTYSSQGKTADRVLAALDQTTGKESFYVAASRARHEFVIYTTDEAKLRKLAAQSRANENASDYLDLFTYEKNYAQNQTWPTETQNRTASTATTDHGADAGVSLGNCAGQCLAAALPGDCRLKTSTSDLQQSINKLDRCLATIPTRDRRLETSASYLQHSLAEFNRANPIAGIDPNAVAHAVTEFVERAAIIRNGGAIANALESIVTNFQQLERISQQFADNAPAPEPVKLTPPTPAVAARSAPPPPSPTDWLTLDQVATLTPGRWSKLTPRQQISLAQAAQDHNRWEPIVRTRVLEWDGQAAHLAKEAHRFKDLAAKEKAELQELEEWGARSLFNPFGVSAERIRNAQRQLDRTHDMWRSNTREINEVLARQTKREQEEADHSAWLSKPQSQGAQHIAELLRQPKLKDHYDSVLGTFKNLQRWEQAAEPLGYEEQKIAKIRQAREDYLDGRGLPEPAWRRMQYDLDLVQEQQRQLKRQQQMEM
jgi:conjugative relaxase-like TrwC/TraI family protein